MYFIDIKYTVWHRIVLDVENKNELKKIMDGVESGVLSTEYLKKAVSEFVVDGSFERMSPSENGGRPTMKLYCRDENGNDHIICDNVNGYKELMDKI